MRALWLSLLLPGLALGACGQGEGIEFGAGSGSSSTSESSSSSGGGSLASTSSSSSGSSSTSSSSSGGGSSTSTSSSSSSSSASSGAGGAGGSSCAPLEQYVDGFCVPCRARPTSGKECDYPGMFAHPYTCLVGPALPPSCVDVGNASLVCCSIVESASCAPSCAATEVCIFDPQGSAIDPLCGAWCVQPNPVWCPVGMKAWSCFDVTPAAARPPAPCVLQGDDPDHPHGGFDLYCCP